MTDRADEEAADEALAPLIGRALAAHDDSQERWDVVRQLSARGDAATFAACSALLVDHDPAARALAADVFGSFGTPVEAPPLDEADEVEQVPASPFWMDVSELLNARITGEHDPSVLQSVIAAAGRLHDPRSTPLLRSRRTHGDQFVRWAIVMALGSRDDDVAVDTLVDFLGDPSPLVRDWAAFAFGISIPERDSPEIRAALLTLLDDEDPIARSEAMRALAVRRAGAEIVDALLATWILRDDLENREPLDEALLLAAAQTGDPRLRELVLAKLREWDLIVEGDPDEALPDDLLAALARYAPDGGGM